MSYTEAQLAEIDEEKEYWTSFGEKFGWGLTGWTGKSMAGFKTGRGIGSLEIMGIERGAIMSVLERKNNV